MIPKPFVPLKIIEKKEKRSLMLRIDEYDKNVASFNSNTRQWEFRNGQIINCGIGGGFMGVGEGFIEGEQ